MHTRPPSLYDQYVLSGIRRRLWQIRRCQQRHHRGRCATGCCVQGVLYEGKCLRLRRTVPVVGLLPTDSTRSSTGTYVGAPTTQFWLFGRYQSGNTIVVGSPQYYSYQVGAAYVYVEPASGWTSMTQTAELYPLFYLTGNFGAAMAISGDTICIGAPHTEGLEGSGVVYTFVKPTSGWTSTSAYNVEFVANSGSTFGQAVGFNGTTAVVGYAGAATTLGGADAFSFIP
jgi:hypothetical protein